MDDALGSGTEEEEEEEEEEEKGDAEERAGEGMEKVAGHKTAEFLFSFGATCLERYRQHDLRSFYRYRAVAR